MTQSIEGRGNIQDYLLRAGREGALRDVVVVIVAYALEDAAVEHCGRLYRKSGGPSQQWHPRLCPDHNKYA
eukprot:9457942-Pyramimonas_sp.AAC.1